MYGIVIVMLKYVSVLLTDYTSTSRKLVSYGLHGGPSEPQGG